MIQTDIFLTEVYDFLQTVTIKNTYLADRKRAEYESAYSTVIDDEHDNPYYINLIGEYSSLDEMMYVTPIDVADPSDLNTDGKIEFTKSNLEKYHKTYTTYRIPNDEFNNLVERYPNQADLIKSIIYPVSDIDTAINANNYSLLSYDTSLLEDQEISSILDAVSTYLTMFRERWHIPEFYYEAYYPMSEWWLVWTLLPLVIFRQRVANIGTSRAHTSQIWEYLTSNGLGDYRSVLDFDEQMFLYKNLRYLIQNRGKDGTLSILSENLLYPRSVALRSKSIMLNTEESTDQVKPSAEVISRDIRDIRTPTQAIINGVELFEDIFEREYTDGLEPKLDDKVIEEQKLRLDHSKLSWLPTKLVEIQKQNTYDEFHDLYVNVMVETILYRISRNELDYNLEVKFNDSTIIPLTVQEAVALLFYTMGKEYETKVILTSERFDDQVIPLQSPVGLLLTVTVESLIGKYITLSTGETVELTDLNKADYIGMTVDIINPRNIPTTAHIVHAYKDEFPEIEQEFQFKDSIWRINRLIDYDDIFERIETNVGSIDDPDRLLELIDGHFTAMVTDINSKRAIANTAYQMAYDLLYRQLLAAETISLDFGIGHTTYEEWFSANQFLEEAIASLDNSSDVKLAYSNMSDTLLEAIMPITESKATVFTQFTSEEFKLLKQMFIQLCSYNIAFLDTDLTNDTYIRFEQLVYHDKSILEYWGEIILDPDPFELEIADTYHDITRIYMDIVKSGNAITHSRLNNFAYIHERTACIERLWTPKYTETKIWADASDESTILADGSNTDQLKDKSGNDANLIPFAPENRLQTGLRTLNGLNVLDGDGSQWLECDNNFSVDSYGGLAIFQVAAVDSVSNIYHGLHSIGNADYSRSLGIIDADIFDVSPGFHGGILMNFESPATNGIIPGVTIYENPPHVGPSIYVTEVLADTNNTVVGYVDGTEVTRSLPDEFIHLNTIFTRVHLMRSEFSGTNVDGIFGEFIVVANPTPEIRAKVEGYLAWKWGLVDNLPESHLYKLEPPMKCVSNKITNNIVNDISRFDIIQSSVYKTTKPWLPTPELTEAWYDAADLSTITDNEVPGKLELWLDKSVNDYHAEQVFESARPSIGIRSLNGVDIIDFNGSTDYLKLNSGPAQDSDGIVIAVIDFDGNTQRQRGVTFQDTVATRWSMEWTNGNNFEYNQDDSSFAGPNIDFSPPTGAKIFGGWRNGGENNVGVDGVYGTPEQGAISGPLNEWRIGAYRGTGRTDPDLEWFLDAGVAEIIIVKQYSLELLKKLEGYLAWKWGLVGNLPSDHPYKNYKPMTISYI